MSQSGYFPYQAFAALREAYNEREVDIAIFEVFKDDQRYLALGDDLYAVDLLARTPSGLPAAPIPLPDSLHARLLSASAGWRLSTLVLGRRSAVSAQPDATYREVIDWTSARGIRLILLEVPMLDRPFAESAAGLPQDWSAGLIERAGGAGAQYVRLAEALADQDVTALRADTCCHYNAHGHDALAKVLEGAITSR